MELTYEAAQAETQRLAEQRQSLTDKHAALQASLEATQASAGEAVLAGTSTTKIVEQIGRMQTELQITERALQALGLKEHEARQREQRARIADLRRQAVENREQAAAIRAEAEPYLAALERIEGVRPELGQYARSERLEYQAHRIDLNTEELAFRMEPPR